MPASRRSIRLRPDLDAEIRRLARRSRRSFSRVAQDLIDEALRVRWCPGIRFADEGDVREAKLTGTGLGVWEVVRDWLASGKDAKRLSRALPSVSEAQASAATRYYERFPDEIDAAIEENARLSVTPVAKRLRGRPRIR